MVYQSKWFTISVLINPFYGSGTAKYICQPGSLTFLQFFPTALDMFHYITRCHGNFINLSAIIFFVELRLAEHSTKFRRDLQIAINGVTPDVFKIPPKRHYNTENIAAKFCTACSNTLLHILWNFLSKSEMVEREAFVELTQNDPNAK